MFKSRVCFEDASGAIEWPVTATLSYNLQVTTSVLVAAHHHGYAASHHEYAEVQVVAS